MAAFCEPSPTQGGPRDPLVFWPLETPASSQGHEGKKVEVHYFDTKKTVSTQFNLIINTVTICYLGIRIPSTFGSGAVNSLGITFQILVAWNI